jgi:hypothetical protein
VTESRKLPSIIQIPEKPLFEVFESEETPDTFYAIRSGDPMFCMSGNTPQAAAERAWECMRNYRLPETQEKLAQARQDRGL